MRGRKRGKASPGDYGAFGILGDSLLRQDVLQCVHGEHTERDIEHPAKTGS
jgi:hypothetical protein